MQLWVQKVAKDTTNNAVIGYYGGANLFFDITNSNSSG